MRLLYRSFLLIACLFWPVMAFAIEAGEQLADPVLEARAVALSMDVRCLVCSGEAVHESSADFAKSLRLVIRQKITDGESDDAIRAYLVARYGEAVLMRPRQNGFGLFLWWLPVILLIGGVAVYRFVIKNR